MHHTHYCSNLFDGHHFQNDGDDEGDEGDDEGDDGEGDDGDEKLFSMMKCLEWRPSQNMLR